MYTTLDIHKKLQDGSASSYREAVRKCNQDAEIKAHLSEEYDLFDYHKICCETIVEKRCILDDICEANGINKNVFAMSILEATSGASNSRTLLLYGPSGTGKSLILHAIRKPFFWGDMDRTMNCSFPWERLLGKNMYCLDELRITPENIDDLKQICGKESFYINVKNSTALLLNPRPCICATNNIFPRFIQPEDLNALKRRCMLFKLDHRLHNATLSSCELFKFCYRHGHETTESRRLRNGQ